MLATVSRHTLPSHISHAARTYSWSRPRRLEVTLNVIDDAQRKLLGLITPKPAAIFA